MREYQIPLACTTCTIQLVEGIYLTCLLLRKLYEKFKNTSKKNKKRKAGNSENPAEIHLHFSMLSGYKK